MCVFCKCVRFLVCACAYGMYVSVLPRPFLQGAAPCPFLVTHCLFLKAEMTPCLFCKKKIICVKKAGHHFMMMMMMMK